MRWSKWGHQPYANFKTAHFVEYLDSMLMNFHETYNWDPFDETIENLLYLGRPFALSSASFIQSSHTHTYKYTYMYVC